jgi:hypothetical protein
MESEPNAYAIGSRWQLGFVQWVLVQLGHVVLKHV